MMKMTSSNKRLRALACMLLLALLLLCSAVAFAGTLTWSGCDTCRVKDVYFALADGSRAFVAGSFTEIPDNSLVILELSPMGEGTRLADDMYVEFDDGSRAPLARDGLPEQSTGAGRYAFVMKPGQNAALHAQSETAYAVTCGGSVCVTDALGAPLKKACAGVILNVISATEPVIVSSDDSHIQATDCGENRWQFTMPSADTAILPAEEQGSIVIDSISGMGIVASAPDNTLLPGSAAKLMILPCEGWHLESIRVTAAAGELALTGDHTFVMPEGECHVQAVFAPEKHVLLFCIPGDVEATSSLIYPTGSSCGTVPAGTLVNVHIKSGSVSGVYIVTPDTCESCDESENGYSFLMPNADVNVVALSSDESMNVSEEALLVKSCLAGNTPENTQSYAARVAIRDSKLRMRESPDADGNVLASYENGTALTVIGLDESGEWAQVTVDGKTGWMKLEFLEKVMEPIPDNSRPMIINIVIPEIEKDEPTLVEQEHENIENGQNEFVHILFL